MIGPTAPRSWTGSFRLHADRRPSPSSPASSHGRAPCRSQRKQYAHGPPWQSYGEPSSGDWPTLRASCATTEIGVRSDARPRSLSAVLGNECGNPTHDRVAELRQSFRQIPPSRAIAQALLAVRLHHYAWRASFGRCGSALVGVPSARPGDQASSDINCRREPPRSAVASQLASPRRCPIVFRLRHRHQAFPSRYLRRAEGKGREPTER